MPKSYLLFRCGNEGDRKPVMFFTADSEEEAREAPTWLKRHHPENELLHLGPGEFFEIIEKAHCDSEEWMAATAALTARKGEK